jgi:hypothetical protein
MMMDERIREALVEIADEVRPAPDPYGRLRIRRRRVHRRRAVVAGAGLAVAAAVGITVPMLPDHAGRSVSDSQSPNDIHQWAERLRKSPIRGKIGASDPSFVAEFTRLVADRQRAGEFRVTAPVSEVNVLFLDDIGSARVAFVAFHLATPDPTTKWENASAWFVARPGASAAELASPNATAGVGDGMEPFAVGSPLSAANGIEAGAALGLAPAGCVVETAPLPAVEEWKPEPTGSYVIRTRATERAEWWRVVCAGVVKEMRPADPFLPRNAIVKGAQLDEALRGARGKVNRDLARQAVDDTLFHSNLMAGPARVLWGGKVAGAKPDVNGPFNGEAVLTAWPQVHDGWTLQLQIRHNAHTPDGATHTGVTQWMPNDPTDPNTAVPIRLGESVSVLVVVPDGTATVRAVRDGTLVDAAEVEGLAALVNAANGSNLVFEAVDRDGNVLATANLPGDPPSDPNLVPW